ncbi:MAG: hypothetical protein ABIS66_07140 [Sphingomicrobium sp.]
MAWYYFDTRDDDEMIADDIGVEVADLEAVKVLAARGLVELARDVLPGKMERCLGVDVRDKESAPVLSTELIFKAVILATH